MCKYCHCVVWFYGFVLKMEKNPWTVSSSIDSHSPIIKALETSLSHKADQYSPSRSGAYWLAMPQYQFLSKQWLRKAMAAASHVFIMLLTSLKCFKTGWERHPPTTGDVGSCTPPAPRRQAGREDTYTPEHKLIFLFLEASWWAVIAPFCQRLFNVFQTVPFSHGKRTIWWQILQWPAEFPLTDAISMQSWPTHECVHSSCGVALCPDGPATHRTENEPRNQTETMENSQHFSPNRKFHSLSSSGKPLCSVVACQEAQKQQHYQQSWGFLWMRY